MITDQECGISFFSKCLLLGLKLIWRQPVNLGFNSQNALVFWALSTQNAWWCKGKIFQLDGGLSYTGTRFKFSPSSQTFGMLTTRVLRNQSMNERIVNEALVCQFKSHFLTQSQQQVGNFTHGYMKKLSVRNAPSSSFTSLECLRGCLYHDLNTWLFRSPQQSKIHWGFNRNNR